MRARSASSVQRRTSSPSNRTTPSSGSQKRMKRWAMVVLPAPEGPTSASVSPGRTVSVTSASACRLVPT